MMTTYDQSAVADRYDRLLRLPILRNFRRQEHEAVWRELDPLLQPGMEVLEIGSGTGAYTLDIASRVRQVTALEPSGAMIDILRSKIAVRPASNVSIVHQDFLAYQPTRRFDVVVAIGVLDYIADVETFIAKCADLAQTGIVLTFPQRSIWGRAYQAVSRISGDAVYLYSASELQKQLSGWSTHTVEVDGKTRMTKGMTVIAGARNMN